MKSKIIFTTLLALSASSAQAEIELADFVCKIEQRNELQTIEIELNEDSDAPAIAKHSVTTFDPASELEKTYEVTDLQSEKGKLFKKWEFDVTWKFGFQSKFVITESVLIGRGGRGGFGRGGFGRGGFERGGRGGIDNEIKIMTGKFEGDEENHFYSCTAY